MAQGDAPGYRALGPFASRRGRQSRLIREVTLARSETSNAARAHRHPAPQTVTIASHPSQ